MKYTPAVIVSASVRTRNRLGVNQWLYFGWDDGITVSVAGVSSSGSVVWEADVVNNNQAATLAVSTSNGTNFAQTRGNGPVIVFGRSAQDPDYALALSNDTAGLPGTGTGRPGGPLPKSVGRGTRDLVNPNQDAASLAVALSQVITPDAEAGGAVSAAGWASLASAAGSLSWDIFVAHTAIHPPKFPGDIPPPDPPFVGVPNPNANVHQSCTLNNGTLDCWYEFNNP